MCMCIRCRLGLRNNPAGTSAGPSTRCLKRRWMPVGNDWGSHRPRFTGSHTWMTKVRYCSLALGSGDVAPQWLPRVRGTALYDLSQYLHPGTGYPARGRLQSSRLDFVFRYCSPGTGNDRPSNPLPYAYLPFGLRLGF